MRRRTPLAYLLALAAALAVLGYPAAAGTAAFTTGRLPVPYAHGSNDDFEPAIAAAPDGTLVAAGNYSRTPCQGTVSGCGTDVWRSTDHGRHWRWIGNPFQGAAADQDGFGGWDVDVAVASERNSSGHYNLYVASLWAASNALAVSGDDGRTWRLLPIAGAPGAIADSPVGLPVPAGVLPDRPWVGADGPCTAYLSYRVVPPSVTVLHRYDTCQAAPVPTALGLPYLPAEATRPGAGLTGRFVVDSSARSPHRHALYVPNVYFDGTPEVVISVSDDGGQTWSVHHVAAYPTRDVGVIWPVSAAVDAGGTVYVAWHDSQHAWLASSRDGARTWTAAHQLNAHGTSAVYPTVAASRSGSVVVAWFGTDRGGDSADKRVMGLPFTAGSAVWKLLVTRTSDGGRHWTAPRPATGGLHRGMLCTAGVGCTEPGSRALWDCFGVALDATGRFSAVFTNALPRRDAAHPASHSDFVADR